MSDIHDLQTDQWLTLAQVARMCPGRPHYGTVWRWIKQGVKLGRGPGGEWVRLAAWKIGGHWQVRGQALMDFFEAMTPDFSEPASRSRAPRRRRGGDGRWRFERAMQQLRNAGVV